MWVGLGRGGGGVDQVLAYWERVSSASKSCGCHCGEDRRGNVAGPGGCLSVWLGLARFGSGCVRCFCAESGSPFMSSYPWCARDMPGCASGAVTRGGTPALHAIAPQARGSETGLLHPKEHPPGLLHPMPYLRHSTSRRKRRRMHPRRHDRVQGVGSEDADGILKGRQE